MHQHVYNAATFASVSVALLAVAATVISCKILTLHLKLQISFVHQQVATVAPVLSVAVTVTVAQSFLLSAHYNVAVSALVSVVLLAVAATVVCFAVAVNVARSPLLSAH